METILGIVILYTTIHFFILQNETPWRHRTGYEKLVTSVAITGIILIFLGLMFGN